MRFIVFLALISLTNPGYCNTTIENAVSDVASRIAAMRSQELSDAVVLRYALKESGGECFPVAVAALRLNVKAPNSTSVQKSRDKIGMSNLREILSSKDLVQCMTRLLALWKESRFSDYPSELRKLLLFGQLECVKDRWTGSMICFEQYTLNGIGIESLHDLMDLAEEHEIISKYPVVASLFAKEEMKRTLADSALLVQMAEKFVISALVLVLLAILLPLVIYHFIVRRKLQDLAIRNEVLNKELVRHSQDQEALMCSVRSYLEQGGQKEMEKHYRTQNKG
jgi:hypothetical protein